MHSPTCVNEWSYKCLNKKVKWCEYRVKICILSSSMVYFNIESTLWPNITDTSTIFSIQRWINSFSISHSKMHSPTCVNEWSYKCLNKKVKWCEYRVKICILSSSMVYFNIESTLWPNITDTSTIFSIQRWINSFSISHSKMGSPTCVNEWSWKCLNEKS